MKDIILNRLRLLCGKAKPHQELFDRLSKNDVAIDCGANIGKITAIMAQRGAKVYAFEPNPHAFALLKKKFLKKSNVECIAKAVSVKEGTLKLFMHQNAGQDQVYWSTGSSALDFKSNINKDQFINVPMIGLSAFIENLNQPIALLKMDVEGMECELLSDLIDKGIHLKIAHILVETHDHKIPELKEKTDALRARIKSLNITNIYLDWE